GGGAAGGWGGGEGGEGGGGGRWAVLGDPGRQARASRSRRGWYGVRSFTFHVWNVKDLTPKLSAAIGSLEGACTCAHCACAASNRFTTPSSSSSSPVWPWS